MLSVDTNYGSASLWDYKSIFLEQKAYYCQHLISIEYDNSLLLYTNNPIIHNTKNLFENLARCGHFFWINQNGNIIYNHNNKSSQILFQNIEWFLNSLSKENVKIFKTKLELDKWCSKHEQDYERKEPFQKLIHDYKKIYSVALDLLPIVLDEVFDVGGRRFITHNNKTTFYINKFCPTANLMADDRNFLNTYSIQNFSNTYSITMQYLYYLSGYNEIKFNYILSWLLNMIKFIAGSDDIDMTLLRGVLILVGGKKSGKEIFFNNIIKPLFGDEYCLIIDDDRLSDKKLEKEMYNKIFYNLDNISSYDSASNKNLIQDILIKKDKNTIGIIITTDRQYVPYELQNIQYSVFKIPDDIEQIYLPSKYEFSNLKSYLNDDLINFSIILKHYASNIPLSYTKDIDISKEPNLDNCIIEFAKELIGNVNILKEIKSIIIQSKKNSSQELDYIEKLYNKHKKIERKYIRKLFNYKYGFDISSKILYSELEKFDPNFFRKSLAPGGAKCFYFPNSN